MYITLYVHIHVQRQLHILYRLVTEVFSTGNSLSWPFNRVWTTSPWQKSWLPVHFHVVIPHTQELDPRSRYVISLLALICGQPNRSIQEDVPAHRHSSQIVAFLSGLSFYINVSATLATLASKLYWKYSPPNISLCHCSITCDIYP